MRIELASDCVSHYEAISHGVLVYNEDQKSKGCKPDNSHGQNEFTCFHGAGR